MTNGRGREAGKKGREGVGKRGLFRAATNGRQWVDGCCGRGLCASYLRPQRDKLRVFVFHLGEGFTKATVYIRLHYSSSRTGMVTCCRRKYVYTTYVFRCDVDRCRPSNPMY